MHFRNYCVELLAKPRITSYFQGLECILCLNRIMILLKCFKEILTYGDSICSIQGNNGEWNSRMNHLQPTYQSYGNSHSGMTMLIWSGKLQYLVRCKRVSKDIEFCIRITGIICEYVTGITTLSRSARCAGILWTAASWVF